MVSKYEASRKPQFRTQHRVSHWDDPREHVPVGPGDLTDQPASRKSLIPITKDREPSGSVCASRPSELRPRPPRNGGSRNFHHSSVG